MRLSECLLQTAQCMNTRMYFGKQKQLAEWFDNEYVMERRKVRKCLRKFRKLQFANSRQLYSRKEYIQLLKKERKQYKDKELAELLNALGNQQDFWKRLSN